MGRIGAELADLCVVTSDNPRTEDPMAIIDAIVAGMQESKHPYVVIENRVEAIGWAMAHAQKDDVIVLCGKGHETYQEIGHEKRHLDEREVVADFWERSMKELTLKQIADWCGGTVAPEYETVPVTGVESDSRKVEVGDLFVALRGERVDGHDFIPSAKTLGASAALVSRPSEELPCVVVESRCAPMEKSRSTTAK